MAKRRADPIAAHAELIGRVAMAWNSVQYMIFLLFTRLSGLSPSKAEAIFFALKADAAQRDITSELAAVALKARPPLLARCNTILRDIGKRAGERNAATHTIWEVGAAGAITPTQGVRVHTKLRADFTVQFRELESALRQHYADLVALQATFPLRRASPGRAQPRTARPKASRKETGSRSPSRSKRSRPRSSRA
jgi:hypothetical protein